MDAKFKRKYTLVVVVVVVVVAFYELHLKRVSMDRAYMDIVRVKSFPDAPFRFRLGISLLKTHINITFHM